MVQPIAPCSSGTGSNTNNSNIQANGLGNVGEPAFGFEAGARRRTNISHPPLERSQLQQDGAYIYRDFLNDEFRRQNLPDPGQYIPAGTAYHNLNTPSPDSTRAIAQLRVVSQEFAQTPMRQRVREEAARVPLEQLDFQAFSEILYGLFQEGGVTWERIVVLFYFCTDLAARAVRENVPPRIQSIVEWSFQFFSGDAMIQWVFDHGGWLGVLQTFQDTAGRVYLFFKMGFFVAGALALGVYLWRSQ